MASSRCRCEGVYEVFTYVQGRALRFGGKRPEAAGLRHLAFEVDDIDASVADLEDKGISHEDIRIDEYTSKRFVFFQDPDGLPIEFYEK